MRNERYSVGWVDPRGVYGKAVQEDNKRYGNRYINKQGLFGMGSKKVDDHKYETEAKTLPIEACVSMWVIKYGDGTVPAIETREQDKLMWEIGNRLWWANRLKYDEQMDSYEVIE